MPRKAKPLTALEVGRIKSEGLHAAGTVAGLYLSVKPSGARSWILRAMVGNKRRDMGIGGYPDVSLAGAHAAAREARVKMLAGIDPVVERWAARSALMAAQALDVTFQEAARRFMDANGDGWRNAKHRQQWANTLETYAYPVIGRLAVRHIETPHVESVLRPIWKAKAETASRLRGRIEKVLSYAMQAKLREPGLNPARWAGNLDLILGKRDNALRGNHAALDWREVGDFWAALSAADGIGALALRFAVLTVTRSGETRGAEWNEVNLNDGVWTVPADRTKTHRAHRVALSGAAMNLLRGLPRIDDCNLIFPSAGNKPLSDATLGAVIKRLHAARVEIGEAGWIDRKQGDRIATAHGIARSSFRTWVAEATAYPGDIAEAALAHLVGDATERAYQRGDALERRRRLMNDWAAFLAMPSAKRGTVIPLRGAA